MKKMISLLLSLVLVASSVSVFAQDTESFKYNEKEYRRSVSLMMGLLEERVFPETIEENITREQFVAGMVKIFGIEPQSGDSNVYTDVADSEYIGEINAAQSYGWVSESDTFNPKSAITVGEASAIIDRALMYGGLAEKLGGYPNGYMYIANDLGLFQNTTAYESTSNISVADACIIFKNIMFAPMYDITYKNGNPSYKKSDVTYIEEKYDVYKFEGQVTAIGNHSIIMNASYTGVDNYFEIDGKSYTAYSVDENLLGKTVHAYAVNGEDTVVWIDEQASETVTLDKNTDIEIDGLKFKYTQNKRKTTLKLDDTYKVVYNGRRAEKLQSYMIDDTGVAVRLLDTDADGKFDIVFIDRYVYGYVTGIDWVNKKIGIKLPGEMIDLCDDNDIEYIVRDAEGNELELFELETQAVVAVRASEDNILFDISVCSDTVSGTVQSINSSARTITVDETVYNVTQAFVDDFIKTGKIATGQKTSFTLGFDGEIVYMSTASSSHKYGYYRRAFMMDDGTEDVGAKIFTSSEKTENFEFAEKVNNGEKKLQNGDKLYNWLTSKGEGKLVKYKLNDAGKIKEIFFAEDSDGVMKTETELNEGFYKFYDKSTGGIIYRGSTKGFNSVAYAGAATVIVLPTAAADLEDDVKITYGSTDALTSSYRYNVDIYDVDDSGCAGLVVAYETFNSPDRIKLASSYLVTKITDAYNTAEGEAMKLVECYVDGKFTEVYIPDDVAISKTTSAGLCVGDIIRMRITDGIARAVYVDFDYSTGTPVYESKGAAVYGGEGANALSYTDGGIYNIGDSTIVLARSKDSNGNVNFANKDLNTYQIGTYIVCYDSATETARTVTKTQLHSYLGYGSDADYVVIRQSDGSCKTIFVYR